MRVADIPDISNAQCVAIQIAPREQMSDSIRTHFSRAVAELAQRVEQCTCIIAATKQRRITIIDLYITGLYLQTQLAVEDAVDVVHAHHQGIHGFLIRIEFCAKCSISQYLHFQTQRGNVV